MALLGDPVPAETAAAWGLIWACVDDDALMPDAMALATRLAAGPTAGLAATKHALRGSGALTLDAALDRERDLMRTLGRTTDYAEGVAAFLAKRPARFVGR